MPTEWTKSQRGKRQYIEQLARTYRLHVNFGEERFVLLDDAELVATLKRTDSLDDDLTNFREILKGETKRKEAEFRRRTFGR